MNDTTYQRKQSNYFEDRRAEMLPFIPKDAKKVLEVGCGNGAFAAHLKMNRDIHITAIEAHHPAAVVAQERLDRVLCGSIESELPKVASERFDCIILNDVLEHLVDPWHSLQMLRGILSTHGVVVASIPNVRYLPVFKDYLLGAQWQYREYGVLDRTHLRFFTSKSMRDLFISSGYSIERTVGINPLAFSWKMSAINRLLAGRLDDTRYKQFACVARSASA